MVKAESHLQADPLSQVVDRSFDEDSGAEGQGVQELSHCSVVQDHSVGSPGSWDVRQ